MERMPIVSIIVPVYNVAPYLQQCMDSIVNQTYRNIEIICIDDGSTDESGEILEQYARSDNRINVLHTDNLGVSSARNTGLSFASGQYLLFVDGDDWIDLATCQKAVSNIFAEAADVVMWPYIREFPDHSAPKAIFQNPKVFNEIECHKLQRRMIGLFDEELAHPESADALSTVWGKLYRREIVEQNHLRFENLLRIGTYEDGLFNLFYFAYAKSAVYISDYLSHYRKNTGMTSKYRPQLTSQWKTLFSDMQTYIEANGNDSDFKKTLDNRISLSVIGLGLNALALPKREALSEIRNVLSDPEYCAAIKMLPMRYFPLHWWVFFACCRLKFSAGVFLLLKCMERMTFSIPQKRILADGQRRAHNAKSFNHHGYL